MYRALGAHERRSAMNDDQAFNQLSGISIAGAVLVGALGLAPVGALIGWSMGKALIGAGIGALVGGVTAGGFMAAATSEAGQLRESNATFQKRARMAASSAGFPTMSW